MVPQASLVSTVDLSQAPAGSNGYQIGSVASNLVGFYGAAPVVQGAGTGAVTDASGGTAAISNGILTLTGTYNSAIIANAIATLAAQSNALEAALVAIGIISV